MLFGFDFTTDLGVSPTELIKVWGPLGFFFLSTIYFLMRIGSKLTENHLDFTKAIVDQGQQNVQTNKQQARTGRRAVKLIEQVVAGQATLQSSVESKIARQGERVDKFREAMLLACDLGEDIARHHSDQLLTVVKPHLDAVRDVAKKEVA
jgi:hypothetical protein